MNCQGCGFSLKQPTRFCPECGTRQKLPGVRQDRKSSVRGDRGRGALSRFVLKSSPGDVAVEIPWNRVIRVGRHPSTDITLIDPSVSRFHAELITTEDGCLVRDLHSSNGTFVNGVSIRELTLRHRDDLQFGNVKFNVREQRAGEPNGPPISVEQKLDDVSEPKMRHLIALSASMAKRAPPDALLEEIVNGALAATGADRASIAWLNLEEGELTTGAFQSRTKRDYPEHRIPRSIARHCVSEGVAVITESAERDSRFHGQSIVALGVRSAMCAPIRDPNGRTLGVVYVDKVEDASPFGADDLSYLVALSSIAAAAANS